MSRRKWTAAEIRVLERYPEEGIARVARQLGRSENSVSSMAWKIGFRTNRSRPGYTGVRAESNRSVNSQFFDNLSFPVAYVLGVVWGWGSIRLSTRKVLILDCPEEKQQILKTVRSLIQSHHSLQRRPQRVRLEVCNSRLVQTLIEKFSYPPRRKGIRSGLPQNILPFLGSFARGLLDSAGRENETKLTWTGPKELMSELQQHIRGKTALTSPSVRVRGRFLSITWDIPYQLRILRAWLPDRPTIQG